MPNNLKAYRDLEESHKLLQLSLEDAKKQYGFFGRFYSVFSKNNSQQDPLKIPNIHLSYPELGRKINLINNEIKLLESKMKNIANSIVDEDLRLELKQLKTPAEKAEEKKLRITAILAQVATELNNKDIKPGDQFFTEMNNLSSELSSLDVMNISEPQRIYDFAEKIIVLLDVNLEWDANKLWKCWNIINIAHSLKSNELKFHKSSTILEDLKEYGNYSKRILKFLLQHLPFELQPLHVLFMIGDHSSVAKFLNEYFALPPANTDAKIDLVNNLHAVLQNSYITKAQDILANKHEKFRSLDLNLQKNLIEQQACVMFLTAYYEFEGSLNSVEKIKEIKYYTDELNNNIVKAINIQDDNNNIISDGTAKYKDIVQKLKTIGDDARSRIYWDKIKESANKGFEIVKKAVTKDPDIENNNAQSLVSADPSRRYAFSPDLFTWPMMSLLFISAYTLGWLQPLFTLASIVFDPKKYIAGAGVGLVMINEGAKTAVIPDLEDQLKDLKDLPDYDSAFIHQQDVDWRRIKNLQSSSEITEFKDEHFKKIADKWNKYFTDKYEEKQKKLNLYIRKVATDTTSSAADLGTTGLQVLAGTILTVTAFLITVFALSGLTGPFLLFAFVPSLSVGIIASLAVVGIKAHFEDQKDVVEIINKVVSIIFLPVLSIGYVAEFLFKPVSSTMAMLSKDSNGNSPSKRSKILGVLTISLAIGLAVGLGVAFPIVAPALGIAAGLAITSGIIVGAYTGLTLGALTNGLIDYLYNSPSNKINDSEKHLDEISNMIKGKDKVVFISKFKDKFKNGDIAKRLIDILEERVEDIRKIHQKMIQDLPQLLSVAPVSVANPNDPEITAEMQVKKVNVKIGELATITTILEVQWKDLLDTFNAYESANTNENLQELCISVDAILSYKYNNSTREQFILEAANIKSQKEDPKYNEAVKPTIIFSSPDDNSSCFIKKPDFGIGASILDRRKNLDELCELKKKFHTTFKVEC